LKCGNEEQWKFIAEISLKIPPFGYMNKTGEINLSSVLGFFFEFSQMTPTSLFDKLPGIFSQHFYSLQW
jgi:hypothetical protein